MSEVIEKYDARRAEPNERRELLEAATTCPYCHNRLTVAEAARSLGVAKRTLFRWLETGKVSRLLDQHIRGWLTARLPK